MKGICDKCGQLKQLINTSNGKTKNNICITCYRHDESRHEICLWCSRKRQVALRTKYGRALCMVCLNTIRRHFTYLWAVCAKCGQFKEVRGFTKDTGAPLCCKCHKWPRQDDCPHSDKPVYARGRCYTCYRRWRWQNGKNKKVGQSTDP